MKQNYIYLISALLLVGLCILLFGTKGPALLHTGNIKTYTLSKYGIEFKYVDSYFLDERGIPGNGSDVPDQYVISLLPNQVVKGDASNTPGEGPTSISITLFQNTLGTQKLEDWIKKTPGTNGDLATSGFKPTMIAGASGVEYNSTGLYEAKNIVLVNGGTLVYLSVTYLTSEDQILKDFGTLLTTLTFSAQ